MPELIRSPLLTFSLLLLISACQSESVDNSMMVDPDEEVSFSADVAPILTNSCSPCHIGRATSGVNLSDYDRVTSSVGAVYAELVVKPGDAENSPLVDKVEPNPTIGGRMPQGRSPLSAANIATIRAWIDEGALNN